MAPDRAPSPDGSSTPQDNHHRNTDDLCRPRPPRFLSTEDTRVVEAVEDRVEGLLRELVGGVEPQSQARRGGAGP